MVPPTATACRPRDAAPAPPEAPAALDLSIVIVNWNTCELLAACLSSVLGGLGALAAEVIVVDNASADESAAMTKRAFPAVSLIANQINRGFAAANNQAMGIARGRYVLLLNPDTVILDDALPRSVAYADAHPDVAVVGCQVLESHGAVQRTCFRFPSLLSTLLWVTGLAGRFPRSRLGGRATYGPWDRCSERDVDVVSGMFMLVRRRAIESVGLMDEGFFVYAEEADWCRRFRSAGWRCVFAPAGRILHVGGGGQSTGQASTRMYVQLQKSVLRYHRKHRGPLAYALARLLFASAMAVRSAGWLAGAVTGGGYRARRKARRDGAAARYHLTGREPAW